MCDLRLLFFEEVEIAVFILDAHKLYFISDAELIEYTNRLTANYTEEQYQRLEEIFVTCSKFEMAFWDMGWEMRA